ncbi:RING finger [Pyrenophora seminiperda CCB06]|uniref:RBR-type E3 ubiquitin transferase n=1 Tax=Pyrenophora seminiperda CCB06 TaxID=1302712 RepID=A0A3M7MFF8_9PLEO|nr:RING finger [Pyrenophora seminiperda CCB06]
MAPLTRLRATPGRRVNYDESSAPSGTRANPVLIHDMPESTSSPAPTQPAMRAGRRHGDRRHLAMRPPQQPLFHRPEPVPSRVTRVKDGAVIKPPSKERPIKQECSICATAKVTTRNFKASDNSCEHFKITCILCIQKLLKTKIAERELQKTELKCPFGNCAHELSYQALKTMLKKSEFDIYDLAVTKYAISAGESYVACLSPTCGLHFSVEDCKEDQSSRETIACPYCEYETCFKCNRPWESHGEGGCDKAKKAEDAESEATIKKIGAKPCPHCGIKIEKNGGCDHVQCRHCRHNFCFACLVEYTPSMVHRVDCPSRTRLMVNDPANWAPPNFTVGQLNRMIAQADALRDNPAPAPQAVATGPGNLLWRLALHREG